MKRRRAPWPAADAKGVMSKGPSRNDLFAIFPDLPWHRHGITGRRIEQVQRWARQTLVREKIRRQQEATERVRAAIAGRQHPTRRSQ
jgi:hypothetical protein